MATIEQRIKWLVDRGSQRQASSQIKSLRDEITQSEKRTDRATRANREFIDSQNDLAKAAGRARSELERQERATRGLENAQERFDAASRQVALAGDVQSNLGAISGLAGASGLPGGGSIAIGGELVALVEELPRLKTALAGLPSTVGAAVQALGPVGIGLGAAVVGLGVVAAVAARQINQAGKDLESAFDALSSADTLARTGTIGDITDEFVRLSGELEDAIARQARAQSGLEALGNPALQGVFGAFGPLAEELRESNTAVEDLRRQLDALDAARNDERVITNTQAEITARLAEEERALADARQAEFDTLVANRQGLLAEISSAGFDIDAFQTRREALLREQAVLIELAQTYGISEAQAEQFQTRLVQIDDSLKFLSSRGQEVARINTERARSEQAAADAADGFRERMEGFVSATRNAIQEQARVNREIADIERRRAESVIDITREFADAAQDAVRDLDDARSDAARSLNRDLSSLQRNAREEQRDIRVEAQRDEARALRTHLRELEQIRKDAQASEDELVANRDFAGLARLRRDTARQLEQTSSTFTNERREQRIALQDRINDQARAFELEREQRRAQYEQDLEDAKIAYQREREQAAIERRRELRDQRIAYEREARELNRSLSNRLQQLTAGAQAEARLAVQTSEARLSVFQQELSIVQQLRNQIAGIAQQASTVFTQNVTINESQNPAATQAAIEQTVVKSLNKVIK
jgi:hypothetical protein